MSEFTRQYKELFGKDLEWDPLKQPTPRTAIPRPSISVKRASALGLSDETGKPDLNSLFEGLPTATPVEESDTLFPNLRAGIAETGAMIAGAGEYFGRQAEENLDPGVAREIAGDIRRGAQASREGFQQTAADFTSAMDPDEQEYLQRRIFTLDPDQTIFQGGVGETASAIATNLVRMAPASLTTLLGTAVLHRVGLSKTANLYMGSSEGVMSLGGIQNAVADEVNNLPPEKLAEIPKYVELVQSGVSPQRAKDAIIAEAQGMAPIIAGTTVAAISAAAGRYFEPIFKGEGGNIVRRFGRGYAIEAPQEGAQGGAEQIAQNYAAQAYDKHRTLMEGVPQAMGEEAFYGGAMGGATTAVLGRNRPPAIPPPGATPDGTAPGQGPAPFSDVFGEGGESPFIPPDQDPYADRIPDEYGPRPSPADLAEAGQQEMDLYTPEEIQRMQAEGRNPRGPSEQQEMDLRPPTKDVALARGQIDLPLKQWGPRTGRQPIPASVPDVPSAEPVQDLIAQIDDMEQGNRLGVYLSPDVLASEDGQDALNTFMLAGAEQGQLLENFDDKGGAMIARDNDAAQQLMDMKRAGADMQRIIGTATGAGTGKPVDGDTAVQRRDEAGNVLQESLVPEREAAALASQWQNNYPEDEVVVLSPDEVIARRGELISENAQARTGDLFSGYMPPVRQAGEPRPLPETVEKTKTTKTLEKSVKPKITGYRLTEKGGKSKVYRTAKGANAAAEKITAKGGSATVVPIRFPARKVYSETETTEQVAPTGKEAKEVYSTKEPIEKTQPPRNRPGTLKLKGEGRKVTSPVVAKKPPLAQYSKAEEAAERTGSTAEIEPGTTDTRTAARMIAAAVREKSRARGKKVQGFYSPASVEIADKTLRSEYAEAWNKLAEADEKVRLYGESFPIIAEEAQIVIDETVEELARITELAEPVQRAGRTVKAAEEISPGVTAPLKSETIRKARKEDSERTRKPTGATGTAEDLAALTPEQIAKLSDKELIRYFYLAAQVQAGGIGNTILTYEAPTGGTEGNAPDADYELPAYLSGAEAIPEGSELLAVSTTTETVGDTAQYKLDRIEQNEDGSWTYTLTSEAADDISGTVIGTKSEAIKRAKALLSERNARAKKRREKTSYGSKLQSIVAAHPTPSQKKKLVARVALKLAKAAAGNKQARSEGAPLGLAKKSKDGQTAVNKSGKAQIFSSELLYVDETPRDESVSARIQRKEAGKAAREKLRASIDAASDVINDEQGFAEIANEQEPETGDRSWRATQFRLGRMYFAQIMQLGQAYLNSPIDTKATTKLMRKMQEFIDRAVAMKPEKFGETMYDLAQAEQRDFIAAKSGKGDKRIAELRAELLTELQDPGRRERAINEWNDNLRRATANLFRRAEVWRKNEMYKAAVEPIIEKISESVARIYRGDIDKSPLGYIPYKPTKEELEGLRWALQNWNNKERMVRRNGKVIGSFYDEMYKPLKRFFMDAGYTFDEKGNLEIPYNEDGTYTPTATDKALKIKYKSQNPKAKTEGDPMLSVPYVTGKSKVAQYEDYQRSANPQKQLPTPGFQKISGRAETAVTGEVRVVTKWYQANRIIEQYKQRISDPKITVAGLLRQEQRLIRNLKELGLWIDTPSKALGKIMHPDKKGHKGVTKTFSIAGPRLEAKLINKARAKELMLNITPFRLPKVEESVAERAMKEAQKEISTETDFFLEKINTGKFGDAFLSASSAIGDLLNFGVQDGHDILDAIIENVPEGHPYHDVAVRLRALSPTNIPVQWSNAGGNINIKESSGAQFRTSRKSGNDIVVNREAYLDISRTSGAAAGSASLIHATLHELTHAATINALRTDRTARQALSYMQIETARWFRKNGIPLPYGLRVENPVEEFVAEAFTSTAFQMQLKEIRFDKNQNMWQRFVSYLRSKLGMETVPQNMLEMVMATSGRLFTDTAYVPKADTQFDIEAIDPTIRSYVGGAVNTVIERGQLQRAIKAGKWAGVRAPLHLMTLTQIRNEFSSRLKGLDDYYRAFKRRDARNAELLEDATKVSQQWTKLTEKHGAAMATEFSWIATTATVHSVDPTVPLSDEKNSHVKEQAAKDVHAELRRAFQNLPQEWQGHWKSVQKYYGEALERESLLLTQNALRAVLTKGADAMMEPAEFEKEFTIDVIKGLNTKKALTDKLGDVLTPDMIATVTAMRTIRQKHNGPYFPIMRYGDYVITAKKTRETKKFSTEKEARAWRQQEATKDPTLELTLKLTDNGGATVKVDEVVFMLAESPTEAQIKRDELVQEYGEENVPAVRKKLEYGATSTIQSNDALGRIIDQLEGNSAAQAAVKQYYLRSLADSSFRKHEIRRKNRRGYDSKLQHRNFTNYAQSASYYTAQLEYGWQMGNAMQAMREDVAATTGAGREGVRKSEIMEIIADRDAKTSNMDTINKWARKGVGATQFMMLTSPAYWMINATQPYMVSLPYMGSRHGYGASMAALGQAQKLIISPLVGQAWNSKAGLAAFWSKTKTEEAYNVLDEVKKSIAERMEKSGEGARGQELINMLDELRRESIIDLSWAAELRDISEGTDLGFQQRLLDSSRIMSHLTEVNNRVLTAIAAYNLARTNSSNDDAIEYAKDVVSSTHFDYSSGSKPLMFRPDGPLGAMAPLVFQFMQWPQHMYAMYVSNAIKIFKAEGVERKEAAKLLLGLTGTHLAAAGIIGTMLQPVKWAIGLIMLALSDDDDAIEFKDVLSGEAVDRAIQGGISAVAGPTVGEIMARGLPSALGSDMSSRMSLGTLYFMDIRPETMESTLGSVAMSMGGAWLSLVNNGFRAGRDLFEGKPGMAVERIAPKMLKDVLKTYRYASEGLVNNAGDQVIEGTGIPPHQLFLQSLGFASSEVSNFYNKQGAIKDVQMFAKDRKASLLRRYVNADDADTRREVMDEIAAFNKRYPAELITRSSLLKSQQSKQERERNYKKYGANLKGKARVYADEGWYYQ